MEINLKTGEVVINGENFELTRYDIKTLELLKNKKFVTLEEIYEKLYHTKAGKLSLYDKQLIYNVIARLRLKLKDHIRIISRYGFGYELEEIK